MKSQTENKTGATSRSVLSFAPISPKEAVDRARNFGAPEMLVRKIAKTARDLHAQTSVSCKQVVEAASTIALIAITRCKESANDPGHKWLLITIGILTPSEVRDLLLSRAISQLRRGMGKS